MEVEYNPQLGYRRTIFKGNFDFLLRIADCRQDDTLTFTVDTYKGGRAAVKISFPSRDTFRFRMFPPGKSEKAGNPIFDFPGYGEAQLTENDSYYEYGTDCLKLRFAKAYWEMSVWFDGKLLTREQIFDTNVDNRWKYLPVGFACDEEGNWNRVWESLYLYSDEAFWGFGEKFTGLNKRGQRLNCWQKDALCTNTEDSYKGHPFFISSRGYGVLLNTYTRSAFDMGAASQVSYSMSAEDGALDYVFLAGSSADYKGILTRYVKMTGKIPIIPKWAFGFWMSKCSYRNRQEIEEVVLRAEKEDIPIDVIHIDGWQKREQAGLWEWDEEHFPDPAGMIAWLKEHGVHLSLWMYPYLQENSSAFEELARKGYFIKDKSGSPAKFYATADSEYRAACFDFTNPEFLAWYKERVMRVLAMGVSVIKTDFSEAVPEDAVFYDGSSGIEGHNKLTYLYAETIYKLMQESSEKTGIQPLLWGRSGFAGSHRIPAAWAGDSSSALNNHAAILRGGLSLALSGVAFWGFDLGGFYNTDADGNECRPSEEEYLRSVELGFFMPLSRAHGKTEREPWHYSEQVLDIFRKYDKIRHYMLPYLYSSACTSSRESVPMLRPMLLEYPEDFSARERELQYMLGKSLLVAPPFDREKYEVYLPQGRWLDLRTKEILEGGRYVSVCPNLSELPVFLRENTIFPTSGAVDSFGSVIDGFDRLTDSVGGVIDGSGRLADNVGGAIDSVVGGTESVLEKEGSKNLKVQLLFESEMHDVFYDCDENGEIVSYTFHAYKKDGEENLYIETDMDIDEIEVFTSGRIENIFVNNECSNK
ncbi:MAG: hypothetical protein NC400_10575 [Clostridium sp.]|nr:hypothetical protein [Clostridium sp.]